VKKKLALKLKTFLQIFFLCLILCSCDFSPYYLKYIEQGQNFLKNQRYVEAAQVYEKILMENPPKDISVRVNFQLGELYSIYLKDSDLALKHYKAIISIENDPTWLVKSKEKIANIYFSFLNNYNKSKISYKILLDFKPQLPNFEFYYFRYLKSIFNNKEYRLYQKIFSKKINKSKYYNEMYFLNSVIYFYQKEYSTCINKLKYYLTLDINPSERNTATLLMANSFESMEDLESAYNLFYKLKKTYPNTRLIDERLKSIYNRKVSRKR